MTTKTVDIQGLVEYLALLGGDLSDLRSDAYEPLRAAMTEAGKIIKAQIQQNLTDNDSVGTGDLRASVYASDAEAEEKSISLEIGVGRNLPYAPVVEGGAEPFTPPLSITEPGQPLYAWVQVKNLAGVYAIGTRLRMGARAKKIDQNRRMARAVWAKIRRSGIRARPYFFRSLKQTADEVAQLFSAAVDKLLENV